MPAWAIKRVLIAAALVVAASGAASAQMADLVSKTAFRVCADPANAPMSMKDGSGFENKIAELFAAALDKPLEYTWYPMSTGFIRNTLRANKCDVVIGLVQGYELTLNTNHYMTTAYLFIAPKDGPLADVTTLTDARLKGRKIGLIAGSPPASHLARLGLMKDVKGYPLFVDRRYYSPAEDMLADLEAGKIDAAILWGPFGGPLVKQSHPDLIATPLLRETLKPQLYYRIVMGVRQGEHVWKRKLNSLIRRNQDKIDAILREAGVPLLTDMGDEPKSVSN